MMAIRSDDGWNDDDNRWMDEDDGKYDDDKQ